MSAVYALLGIVLGVAIDEALRRFHWGEWQNAISPPEGSVSAGSTCRFVAQDFYDR